MRVRFSETCIIKGPDAVTFKAGEEYELSEPSAQRWIRRAKAVEVEGNANRGSSEAAVVEPDENAARPLPRRRGKAAKTGGD